MSLMRAFGKMLGDVTSEDASARQVTGILTWREYAQRAVRAGEGLPCSPSRRVLITDSRTHRQWRAAAEAILGDLREQANDADVLYAEKTAEAADWDAVAEAAESDAGEDDGDAEAEAEEARRRAAEAREVAGKAMAWGIAAQDAYTSGTRLVAGEDAVAVPVGDALAAAGGITEVYGTKHALTVEGQPGRHLATRGTLALRGGPR